mmetsp:Transcript_2863/g.5919  ORF Transcript_2863/g.5919 Transcript_2863/m.5919 type:complete len:114 (+) Transcript_2863:117-458(+)
MLQRLALFLALFALSCTALNECKTYSSDKCTGAITTSETCRTACEKVEGLCCPDFKTSTTDGVDSYKCNCRDTESGSGSQNRDLCQDSDYSGAFSVRASLTCALLVISAQFLL